LAQRPGFDEAAAHRFFSTECFNRAWELIEKRGRTSEEEEEMIRLNQASLWHWTQREDCTDTNLAIGYWQASRIHAVLGRADEARHYGHLSLLRSRQAPFLEAYAYEALARAEGVAGNGSLAGTYRAEAMRLAAAVADPEEKKLLTDDLRTLPEAPGPATGS
jgi:hypothetical protein